jgi:hypothetical protein
MKPTTHVAWHWLGIRSHRGSTAGLEHRKKGALCGDRRPGSRIVHAGEQVRELDIAGSTLDRQGTLARGRQYLLWIQNFGDGIQSTKSDQAGPSHHNSVEETFGDFGQPGINIASHADNLNG